MRGTDEKWIVYKALVGYCERKRPIGRTNCRWDDIIETYLKEVVCEFGDWTDLPRTGLSGEFVSRL
jgi:hypothetical protein